MAVTFARPDARPGRARPTGGGFRGRRAVVLATAVAVLVLMLLALVSPLRQLMAQEERVAGTRRQIAEYEKTNASLSQRIRELGTDIEIERLARQDLGLVRPGEEPYVLLPGDPGAVPPPPTEVRKPEPLPKSG